MSGRKRFERSLKLYDRHKEDRPQFITGRLGVIIDGVETVEIPSRPGFVWVRLRQDLKELVQAFNQTTLQVYDLPVLVRRDPHTPTRYVVVGRDAGTYSHWETDIPYYAKHGTEHSFGLGRDITWVYGRQFMPMNATPSGTAGGPNVVIHPYTYFFDNAWKYVGGTGSANLLGFKPAGNLNAKMILLYLDATTGNIEVLEGSEFDAGITGSAQVLPYMPSLTNPGAQMPIAGIRLVTGTARINWGNIYDLKPYYTTPASGTAGGGGTVTGFTEGSVIFASPAGTLTEDNDNFFWKNDTDTLIIGSNAPPFAPTTTNKLVLINEESAAGTIFYTFGGSSGFISSFQAHGTKDFPSGTADEDRLFTFFARGHDGTQFPAVSTGLFGFYASEDWSPSGWGTYARFEVTETGTVAKVEALRLYATEAQFPGDVTVDENLDVGGIATIDELEVSDRLRFGPGASTDYILASSNVLGDAEWRPNTGSNGGGGGATTGTIQVRDNGLLEGASIDTLDFQPGLNVEVTGSVAFIKPCNSTYLLVGIPDPLGSITGTYWKVGGIYATGSLAVFLNGVAQRPGVDYNEQYANSGTFSFAEAPPTGSVFSAMWGVPCFTGLEGPGVPADALVDSEGILLTDSEGIQLTD